MLGFIDLAIGVIIVFISIVALEVVNPGDYPELLTEALYWLRYVGVLVAVFGPLWHWFGRPYYYLRLNPE